MMAKRNATNEPDLRITASLESTLLMAAGLLIILLVQHLNQVSVHKAINTTLLFIGAVSFLVGILSSSSERVAAGLQNTLAAFASRLGVSNSQILLVVFGFCLSLASRSAAGNSLQAHSPWHACMWIAGCVCVIVGCWRGSIRDTITSLDRYDWLALGTLTVISLATRLVQLDQVPYTVSGDEGSVGLMAWDYKSGVRNNLFIMGWFSFPALQFWPASVAQEILGRSVFAMRLPSAIGGALTVLAAYVCVRQLFGRLPGFLAALFLSTFHYHLLFSRIALTNVWDGFFLMLMIASIWVAWTQNERFAFLVAGIAMGLGQYGYTTAHLLPIYAAVWLLVLRISMPHNDRLPGVVSLILVLTAIVLPLSLYYIENPNELVAPLNRVSILKGDWIRETVHATGKSAFMIFAEQFWKTILGFTAQPMLGVYSPGIPMLQTIPATLFLAGLIVLLLRIKDPRYNILLVGLLGPIFASTFSVSPPNAQRLLFSAPIVAAITILPLFAIIQQLTISKPHLNAPIATAAIALMLLIGYFEVRFFTRAIQEGRYSDTKSYVARRIGETLRQQPHDLQVYFLGQPIMGYRTLPCLPYIARNATGHDITMPLDSEQNPPIEGDHIVFVILAHNAEALPEIEGRYPQGTTITVGDDSGQPQFYLRLLQP